MSATGSINRMDNPDYVTVEVDNTSYQVYRMPDLVPKQKKNISVTKGDPFQRVCYNCHNPEHKIANCTYNKPSTDARVAVTNMKNDVPQLQAPPRETRCIAQESHHEQEAWNSLAKAYVTSGTILTCVLQRLNNLEESVQNIAKEVANLTEALQLKNTSKSRIQKRKHNDQAYGQDTYEKLKKPRYMTEGSTLHQPTDVHEEPSKTSMSPEVYQKATSSSTTNKQRLCFHCHDPGHLIARCPYYKRGTM